MKKFLKILCLCIVVLFTYHYIHKIQGLSIVGYHGVVSDEDKEILYKDDPYYLSISQFERHMKYLYDQGYQTLSMQEAEDYYYQRIEIPQKSVVLTFDDGYKNFNEIVKPILEKYHFKATCFVIGKHVEDDRKEFLKEEDLIDNEYISYYSHSYDLHHKNKIYDLSLEELQQDFNKDVIDHTYFAYPYGYSNEEIFELMKQQDVHLAFEYNNFHDMTSSDHPYLIPRYMIVDIMPDFYIHYIYK